jgi:hypothetical protein
MRTSTICSGCLLASSGSISCSTKSFAVEDSRRRTVFVAGFDEVVRATAFKRDELTTDLLCVEIEVANGRSIELHEDLGGFEEWLGRVDSLPGVDPDWRGKVIQPPFARNETALFTSQSRDEDD